MTSQNSITDFSEIFKDDGVGADTSVIPQQKDITDLGEVFTEPPAPSSDEALAQFAYGDPSMTIGEESLQDIDLRGKIAAADTRNEKIAEFKARYPEGELIFVPGKGTAESTL